MGYNNVPVNGWPQIKDLERLNELAQKIDGLSTLTSSDRDWLDEWESKLPELPEDPATDGVKVLTATTDDGETVKSWEDPARGTIDYSTTEQVTGHKWIDGKDIYVKVITKDSDIGTGNIISHNIQNFGECINAFGMMHLSGGSYIPLSYVSVGAQSTLYGSYCGGLSDITSNSISINLGEVMRGLVIKLVIILFYTKSTTQESEE